MMLKVENMFLDFNADIEIERKVKLFQDIETNDGDLSFAFDVELTSNNITALGIPFPDSSSKRVYHVANTEVLDDNGVLVNKGSIRVERIRGMFASCSFLGGNTNWFLALSGNLTDLTLSQYDRSLTESEVIDSWGDESGIIFPVIDTGTMATRSYQSFIVEDFIGAMYVHTLMKEIFQQSGLKIQGELIDNPFYKSLIVVCNSRSLEDIDRRKSYVGKTTSQTIPGSITVVEFENDSILPFFDGAQDNFSTITSRYTADINMRIQMDFTLMLDPPAGINGIEIAVYKNGSIVNSTKKTFVLTPMYTGSIIFNLVAGDYLDIRARSIGSDRAVLSGNVTYTPIFLYEAYGSASVPRWTKRQFVSNIFKLFNCITSYDEYNKTVTVNYFDKIKEKDSVDISEFIEVDEIDYTEFISEFYKQNNFTYQEGNDEDLLQYNISSFVKYGSGIVVADNDFLEESGEVVESDFSSPISYVNPAFNSSFERINYTEFIEDNERDITSVTDNSGEARFHINDANDYYEQGDLIRILTDEVAYNGDWLITNVTGSYIDVLGVEYVADSTGNATRLTHKITTDSNVYLMSVTKNIDTEDFSDAENIYIEENPEASAKLAFFNLLRIGKQVEEDYKQGLSFSLPESPFSFQRTILDTYWRQFDRIVNDPVMLKTTGHLPWKVYNSINFLQPITIRSIETSNKYYCNRILGYKNSSRPCLVELIKMP